MYIRVSRGRLDRARYQDLLGIAHHTKAAITGLPGCQSYLAGGDRAAGTIIAVSTWDTEAHARFSREALGELMPRYQAIGVQLDPPEIYEVVP